MKVLGPKHYSCRYLQNISKPKFYGGVQANIFEEKNTIKYFQKRMLKPQNIKKEVTSN
jgi:hypothetical protein